MLTENINIQTIKFKNAISTIVYSKKLISYKEYIDDNFANENIVIIGDINTSELYAERVKVLFANNNVKIVTLPIGEEHKTWNTVELIITKLIEFGADRKSVLIALGGGIVSDITGFVASIYMRGIRWCNIPSTLIGQVDAAIGGKTGVNFLNTKNLIGAFYQPEIIFSCAELLDTLPKREYTAGLAEIIKYALAFDRNFFDYLIVNVNSILNKDFDTLFYSIQRCLELKVKIVVEDETDQSKYGGRALLNLGHTFAHAIEAITNFNYYLHGEAVAIGLVLAAILSQQQGFISEGDVAKITELLQFVGLPTKAVEFTISDLVTIIYRDKKVLSGSLRLVLLKQIGEAVTFDDMDFRELEDFLNGHRNIWQSRQIYYPNSSK